MVSVSGRIREGFIEEVINRVSTGKVGFYCEDWVAEFISLRVNSKCWFKSIWNKVRLGWHFWSYFDGYGNDLIKINYHCIWRPEVGNFARIQMRGGDYTWEVKKMEKFEMISIYLAYVNVGVTNLEKEYREKIINFKFGNDFMLKQVLKFFWHCL